MNKFVKFIKFIKFIKCELSGRSVGGTLAGARVVGTGSDLILSRFF